MAVKPPGLTDNSRLVDLGSCVELLASLDLLSANCRSENNGLAEELGFDFCEDTVDDDDGVERRLLADVSGFVVWILIGNRNG